MRIYDAPVVHLLATTGELAYPTDTIAWTSDDANPAHALPELAGRLCYLSFGVDAVEGGHASVAGRTTNADYLRNIVEVRHGSVLEHSLFTFLVEGVSRTLSHELVRHRHLSFSQLSQRYVDEADVAFVRPPAIAPGSAADEIWRAACDGARAAYRELTGELPALARKELRQTARAVLPGCVETKLVVTGNARAWRHFLVLRGARAADAEIRRLAVSIATHLVRRAPNLFPDVLISHDGVDVARGSV